MEVIVVTQARSGSTRLPNKVLKKINGLSLLEIHINRIKQATSIDKIIVATTTRQSDDAIVDIANKLDTDFYRGSEDDVLDRFYQAVKKFKPKYVVRLTSDCPLIDPALIDDVVSAAKSKELDYYANILEELYPDGQDIEVFTFEALELAWQNAKLKSEREHVTPYIRTNSSYNNNGMFQSDNHAPEKNYNHVRLTVDEQVDFEVIKTIIQDLGHNKTWKEYADYYLCNDNVKALNSAISRNEGYIKSLDKD